MSDQSAIRLLQTAIENVRETCTSPEYKALLAACEKCDEEAEKCLGQPDTPAEEKSEASPPSRKEGTARVKAMFARAREEGAAAK